MVFFTCDGCNETLKKNQVDGHASRCRNCYAVSCVDCSISFPGDDYRNHTTCSYTEVDNLVANRGAGKTKKQTPQEVWMDLLHSSVDTAPPGIKSYLQQMVQLDNIPRKEKQFRNFATNSLNLRGGQAKKILDSIWNHLNEQREKMKKAKAEADQIKQQKKAEKEKQQSTKDESSATKEASDSKTKDEVSSSEEVSDEDQKGKGKVDKALYKDVKKATKKMLKKAKGQSMKYKSLQKALREKMGVPKEKFNETMEHVIAKERKKFQLEGKQIKLVVT